MRGCRLETRATRIKHSVCTPVINSPDFPVAASQSSESTWPRASRHRSEPRPNDDHRHGRSNEQSKLSERFATSCAKDFGLCASEQKRNFRLHPQAARDSKLRRLAARLTSESRQVDRCDKEAERNLQNLRDKAAGAVVDARKCGTALHSGCARAGRSRVAAISAAAAGCSATCFWRALQRSACRAKTGTHSLRHAPIGEYETRREDAQKNFNRALAPRFLTVDGGGGSKGDRRLARRRRRRRKTPTGGATRRDAKRIEEK